MQEKHPLLVNRLGVLFHRDNARPRTVYLPKITRHVGTNSTSTKLSKYSDFHLLLLLFRSLNFFKTSLFRILIQKHLNLKKKPVVVIKMDLF